MPARLYIGTSNWADRAFVASGLFYPPELKDTPSRLAYYAERFNFGEIDSTYYAFPSRKNAGSWADAVPDGFKFNVKAFALFTQHPTPTKSIPKSFREALPPEAAKKARVYFKDAPDAVGAEMASVFEKCIAPIAEAGKLGALLIDFPPWFVPSTENRAYLRKARELFPSEQVVVEFRDRRWADDETLPSTLELLRELSCGLCCVDEPPGLKESFPPIAAATASVALVRFRGRNAERFGDKKATMEERLSWWYTDEELSEWLPRIEQLRAEVDELYLAFNTKTDDQSVVNASKLQALLGMAT
jgi:uncharacterized protein YecE (DUF72 family)